MAFRLGAMRKSGWHWVGFFTLWFGSHCWGLHCAQRTLSEQIRTKRRTESGTKSSHDPGSLGGHAELGAGSLLLRLQFQTRANGSADCSANGSADCGANDSTNRGADRDSDRDANTRPGCGGRCADGRDGAGRNRFFLAPLVCTRNALGLPDAERWDSFGG